MSRGVHAFWFPPLFLDARLLWALLLFKDWVYFGCLSLSFSFFSSVSIIQFATISMVRVVMDIFINQNASKLFIDFLLCVLLKSGTRGFFVLARVCSYCAGVNIPIRGTPGRNSVSTSLRECVFPRLPSASRQAPCNPIFFFFFLLTTPRTRTPVLFRFYV